MRCSLARYCRFVGDDSGAAAVEFAIVSSAFFTLLFGICYVGIIFFDKASLQWAVERGSRLAMVNTSVTQTDIAAAVNQYLTDAGLPQATVLYSVSNASGYPVANIQASFERSYTLPFVSTFDITFSSSTYVPQASP